MTVAVVEAVSALDGRPPDVLALDHDVLRNDLDEVVEFGDEDPDPDRLVRLTFEYLGYYVTVENDATVSVEEKPEDPFRHCRQPPESTPRPARGRRRTPPEFATPRRQQSAVGAPRLDTLQTPAQPTHKGYTGRVHSSGTIDGPSNATTRPPGSDGHSRRPGRL